jgi:outer membrane receptor protein involved in Fe transport
MIPGKHALLWALFAAFSIDCHEVIGQTHFLTDSLPSPSVTSDVHALEAATVQALAPSASRTPLNEVQRIGVTVLDELPAPSRLLALAALPGVSFQTSGGGTVRPIIRGLSGLRVATLFFGARVESQAWGEHHGIFLPEEGIDRVEVTRGAATLLDAPDAFGGVLRFVPIGPDPEVGRKSAVRLTGHSNTGGVQASLVTRKRSARAYHTFSGGVNRHNDATLPDGNRLDHTDFRQFFAQGRFGYLRDWGTWEGAYTSAYNTAGLIDTEGWHQSGDHLITTSLHVQGGRGWIWHPTVSYQLNHRKEFDRQFPVGEGVEGMADLDLSLRTARLDLRVERQASAWDHVLGIQSGQKRNSNGPIAPDLNPFLPDARVLEAGTFGESTWHLGTWSVSGLVRGDVRRTELGDLSPLDFPMVSAGLGARWSSPSRWNWSVSWARKNRAPSLAELGAQGVHHCVSRVEYGRSDLGVETSHQVEFSTSRALMGAWSTEATAYHQRFANFIYLAETGDWEAGLPVYVAAQTRAGITGFEWSGDYAPSQKWSARWAASWIRATDAQGDPLPLIPPANLRVEGAWHHLTSAGRRLNVQAIGRTSREATLFDGGATVEWNKHIKTTLTVNNAFNATYRTILSQFNNLGLSEPGRNVRVRLEWHF